MKILILPTWIFVNLLTPILPKHHIWYKRKFTLSEWVNGSTDITFGLSIMLWSNLLALIFLICYLIIR